MFWLLIRCPCGRPARPEERQNTRYVDDRRNWVRLCEECLEMNAEYWADMWADYYAGCL